jgi:hypothetical protein
MTVKENPTLCTNSICFLNLLHVYVSVTADHHEGARYRVEQLNNMCIRPKYNYLQLCYPNYPAVR